MSTNFAVNSLKDSCSLLKSPSLQLLLFGRILASDQVVTMKEAHEISIVSEQTPVNKIMMT